MKNRLLALLLCAAFGLALIGAQPATAQEPNGALTEEYCLVQEATYSEGYCYAVAPMPGEETQYVTKTISPNLYTISTVEGSPETELIYSSVYFLPVNGSSFAYLNRTETDSELLFQIANNADSILVSSCSENNEDLPVGVCWEMTQYSEAGMAMFRRLVEHFDL